MCWASWSPPRRKPSGGVVDDAKAWRDKFRQEIKDEIKAEIKAELGVTSDGSVSLSADAEDRISGLEKELSSEESTWKKDLSEKILTHVRELMRHRSRVPSERPGCHLWPHPSLHCGSRPPVVPWAWAL